MAPKFFELRQERLLRLHEEAAILYIHCANQSAATQFNFNAKISPGLSCYLHRGPLCAVPMSNSFRSAIESWSGRRSHYTVRGKS